jgi:hypothetical protein
MVGFDRCDARPGDATVLAVLALLGRHGSVELRQRLLPVVEVDHAGP